MYNVGDKVQVANWNRSINGYYNHEIDNNTTIHSKTDGNPAVIQQIKNQKLSSGRLIVDLYTY